MEALDIRLVVTDMDGTLLDDARRLPERFVESARALAAQGVGWAIASGRQLANLEAQFAGLPLALDFIAENGALVRLAEEPDPFYQDLTPVPRFAEVLKAALAVPEATPVLCGASCAWVHDGCPRNAPEVAHYFARTMPWRQLEEVAGRSVCKAAIYHPRAAEALWPALAPCATEALRVILSGPCWIDVQPARIHKGRGLAALLARRGLVPEQAMVFGDYLNDLEMMTLGTHAVAMGNAHPALRAACAHETAANTEDGVLGYLRRKGLLPA